MAFYLPRIDLVLSVPGIHCPLCPIMVKKSLQKWEGVQDIDVSEEKKTAKVVFDDETANIDLLINATIHAGYPSSILNTSESLTP